MMSTAMPLAVGAAAATRTGSDLRAARERLGWSLGDIASGLRIRLCHLEALEQGDIGLLPGNAYAVGYARTYARALGLDAEEMVRRFKSEAADVGRRTELAFPIPMPDRGLPAGAVILLGLMLSIGAYVGWYRLSGDGHLPAETVTAIPERLAPLAEQVLPAPPGFAATSSFAASSAPAISIDASQATAGLGPADLIVPTGQIAAADPNAMVPLQESAPPVSLISPTSAAAALVRDPAAKPMLALAVPTVIAPAAGAPTVVAPVPDDSRIVVRTSADSWIQVRDRTGSILLSRIMKAGEIWPVPRQDNLMMTTGNAGGTEILVDGATTPSLGSNGAVRHDMPLDPDLIKGGKLAPQLVAARSRQ